MAALGRGFLLLSQFWGLIQSFPISTGVQLSAFNLAFTTRRPEISMSVECAFQGSKVFELGGPYTDIFAKTSREAKKDLRIQASGRLTGFRFFGIDWPLEPLTAFYDWLYLNALAKNPMLSEQLQEYNAFTDIEFNPSRSINCQAYSVALYSSLAQRGMLTEAIKNKASFLGFLQDTVIQNAREDHQSQARLDL